MRDTALELARALIARASITPEDNGCQTLIGKRLEKAGFTLEPMRFGVVDNLWARRGHDEPLFVFAGHTDVVPPGVVEQWSADPFVPITRNGYLYGRGAADMKGGLAAMVIAAECFIAAHPEHRGSLGFLITSDEEGPAVDGTARVVKTLAARHEKIDWCIIGEASSERCAGDTVRVGRRGSLNGLLTVYGTLGHVAYSNTADNPIHRVIPALAELTATQWDAGNAYFPPTSLQISNIKGGVGVDNVVPDCVEVHFNFRYATTTTKTALEQRVTALLDRYRMQYTLAWSDSGAPFLTENGSLMQATREAVETIIGTPPRLSTGGGTSDGRYIAPNGAQVVELGPVNATIHKVDERVTVADLETLTAIYNRLLETLLG